MNHSYAVATAHPSAGVDLPALSATDFLDELPPVLQPASCSQVLTLLQHYRGVVRVPKAPPASTEDDQVGFGIFSVSGPGDMHRTNSREKGNRSLGIAPIALSAGAAYENELDSTAVKYHAPHAKPTASSNPGIEELHIGEIIVGDAVDVKFSRLSRTVIAGCEFVQLWWSLRSVVFTSNVCAGLRREARSAPPAKLNLSILMGLSTSA